MDELISDDGDDDDDDADDDDDYNNNFNDHDNFYRSDVFAASFSLIPVEEADSRRLRHQIPPRRLVSLSIGSG